MSNIAQVAIINVIQCIYGDKRKSETRNVVHLMAATTFIALPNMTHKLQDQSKRCSIGDALLIFPSSSTGYWA